MSDIGPPPRKEPPPSELRIGAPPRPVTRLSRRTLMVATAVVTAIVFAALWYALGIRPLRFAGGPELYNTNAKPTDALANLRDSYADLTRPRPAPSPPQAVPQLGPPLPGDLGRPMLPQTGTPPPAADPEVERRRREREQAAASVVFFTVSARSAVLPGAAAPGQAEGDTPARSLEGTAPQILLVTIRRSRTPNRTRRAFLTDILTKQSTRHRAFRRPAALTSSWPDPSSPQP